MTVYNSLIDYSSKDELSYHELVQANIQLLSQKTLEKEPIQQLRQGVQKDIWRMEGDQRLHLRLKSDQSHLSLIQKKKKIEVIELLKKTECLIQEKIDLAAQTQNIKSLKTEEGVYSFPAHSFFSNTVEMAFYQIPGITLPLSLITEQPFLEGVAQEITLSATNKTPSFHAQFLKLRFDPTQDIQ